MAIRLAIVGLEVVQREWIAALEMLRAAGEIEVVAVGHQTQAAARDIAGLLKGSGTGAGPGGGGAGEDVPGFDDLRLMVKETGPQVLVMDRPANATLDFLLSCVGQGMGIYSLGPPVESLAEAQALAGALGDGPGAGGGRSHLLYTWPRFADSPAVRRCTEADEFARPIRFATATWTGMNYAMAKAGMEGSGGQSAAGEPHPAEGVGLRGAMAVRSLSVLAWDVMDALIRLMGLPLSVFAAFKGTVGTTNSFADLSGAAAVTLRFAEDACAGVTLCDRMGESRRELLLWGAGGTLELGTEAYVFRDGDGKLIDQGGSGETGGKREGVAEGLREFLRQYALPASPHRGWEHRLEEVAATLEAMVVSHRTGQAESPERLRRLRR